MSFYREFKILQNTIFKDSRFFSNYIDICLIIKLTKNLVIYRHSVILEKPRIASWR